MHKRGILLLTITVCLSIILTGCFQGEQSLDDQEEMDPPKDAEAVDNLESESDDAKEADDSSEGEATTDTAARQLYLLDSNGMVVPQTLELPQIESKEVATQAMEYLVKDGPVSQVLPNGFQAVLPAGTQVLGLDLQDNGTLIVDLSKEFENYKASNELKILQAMTYTMTQFDSVNDIKLRVNGYSQSEMPVSGTPISDGYSRVNGINISDMGSVDLLASKPVTLYYPSIHNDNHYFVPVTQYVDVENNDLYGSMIQTLLDGPVFNTNVQHVFNSETELVNNPSLRSGVLEVVFNQEVLKNSKEAVIADEVMETLVRSLSADENVEAVEVKVENIETLFNEKGKAYSEPVTTQMLTPTEKL